MSISGKSDGEDNSRKASLDKARANGFGQKGIAGRKKKDATEIFEERALSQMEEMVDLSITALKRAMHSKNEKTAADAAYKFTRLYYNPEKKLVIEGTDPQEVHYNLLVQQDNLTEAERAALQSFSSFLKDGLVSDEVGEVIDVDGDEVREELPPPPEA